MPPHQAHAGYQRDSEHPDDGTAHYRTARNETGSQHQSDGGGDRETDGANAVAQVQRLVHSLVRAARPTRLCEYP